MSNRFIFTDTSKCIGCLNCELACAASYLGISFEEAYTTKAPLISRNRVIKQEGKTAPLQCMHCESPSCLAVCPHGVIEHKGDFILLHEEACVGCSCCSLICPYGAIKMIQKEERTIALKCNLCSERAEGPSCVQHCPTEAIRVINYTKYRTLMASKGNL